MRLFIFLLCLLSFSVARRHGGRHRPDPPTTTKATTTTTTKAPTTTTTTTAKPTTTTVKATTPPPAASPPANDANTAYFAFKINDPKISERVKNVHQAALKVSKDFSPFLVNTSALVQPLLSFQLEDYYVNRTAEIFDRQLELALCSMLPRRIPYTEFRAVDGGMKAMSETGAWLNKTKGALRSALNRQGFIFHSDCDENMVVIMNPLKLGLSKIDLRPLKLAASARVDKLYICRGRSPSAQFASPCQVVREFALKACPTTSVKDASLSDLIYVQNGLLK